MSSQFGNVLSFGPDISGLALGLVLVGDGALGLFASHVSLVEELFACLVKEVLHFFLQILL